MKSLMSLTVCALSLLVLSATAQGKNAQANGTFDFEIEGAVGTIVFDADTDDGGPAHGSMTFTTTTTVGDPDGTGDPITTSVVVQAAFDCMVVQDNQAVMSGTVTSANAPGYLGQQVILAVVDKVEGVSPSTDGFAWGVYQPTDPTVHARILAAQDYEYCRSEDEDATPGESGESEEPSIVADRRTPCDTDPGTTLTWVASDFELCPTITPGQSFPDPDPTPACVTDPGAFTAGLSTTPNTVDCQSFPLSSYPLNLIPDNKVQVKTHS